jgi:hypothetical protein
MKAKCVHCKDEFDSTNGQRSCGKHTTYKRYNKKPIVFVLKESDIKLSRSRDIENTEMNQIHPRGDQKLS